MAYTITAYSNTFVTTTSASIASVVVPSSARLFAWISVTGTNTSGHTATWNTTEGFGTSIGGTQIGGGSPLELRVFELLTPTAGTHSVDFAWSNSQTGAVGCLVIQGTNGVAAANVTSANGSDSAPTMAVTSTSGDLVLGAACIRSPNPPNDNTVSADGSGQTRRAEAAAGITESYVRGLCWTEEATGASTTIDGTLQGSTVVWILSGYTMSPPSSGALPLLSRNYEG